MADLDCCPLQLVAVPLFEQTVGLFSEKLEVLLFSESFAKSFSFGIKETGIHFEWDVSVFLMGVAKVTPGVEEFSGDDKIGLMF